ncbi:protein-glutamate O-methyltransferase CheR [Halorubellus sp. JP-L1]|uniref:CheR family methyltransferase n=1 Tax=Halorubellus sp. JP-L1 TaxID=2715753 RepID=UPI00140C9F74|nr:protein-glutamate O-methyltransferase CheR [Halorubellus sp. JP-L1]
MSGDAAYERVTAYVEDEIGFATSHYNDSYLQRRLASRMRRTGAADYDEYFEILAGNEEEAQALLDAFSINVTGFFRNPDVWEGIRGVLRDLSAENEHVYVWSAACADGREPYSLAMLAMDDPRVDAEKFHFYGTDINDESLATAQYGEYSSSRTVDIEEQLSFLSNFHAYVERDEDSFRMREGVRRKVTFAKHDLINDDPKSGFDLVVCRNLFIYIDNEYKQPILRTIADSLKPSGYLVIGKAETIPPQLKSAFEVLDGRLRIYRRD